MKPANPRLTRLKNKTLSLMKKEIEDLVQVIKKRPDYIPALETFIKTLIQAQSPQEFIQSTDKKVILSLCIQAPLELFHAAGVQPFKLACGSHISGNMAPLHLPALTCPMIKSISGLLKLGSVAGDFVIPTTCDWVVKFSELTKLHESTNIHFMELPHLRENERSSKRWLNEIKVFKNWLEKTSACRITPRTLVKSINIYAQAYELYSTMIKLRRKQKVPSLHFALIINAMPYLEIETWMANTAAYVLDLKGPDKKKEPIFLTGSPIVFPNYKMLTLIENAQMAVTADDLCTMERTFPGAVAWRDKSEYALLNALAQRNHKACICPTFADNHRRLNSILSTLEQHHIRGIIFHVLKGCHPYDMESGILETQLKKRGYRFLKIETDYVKEDEQNIVTRLEAFRRTLK